MANIVEQIIDESKSIATTTFGVTYQELRFFYDVEKNSVRGMRLAFAIRPLSASPAESVVGVYTVQHSFELILTDSVARADDDSQRETALDTMYSQADEFFKAIINSKINLPTIVLIVESPSFSEPEFVDDNKLVILRMQYDVRWRSSTT